MRISDWSSDVCSSDLAPNFLVYNILMSKLQAFQYVLQRERMSDLQSPFASKAQRDQARNAKKEAVLRAAVDLFNERGFHATSLDDIASRLGIPKPALYHYFCNTEQVLFHGLPVGLEIETARSR